MSVNRIVVTDAAIKSFENRVRIAEDVGECVGHNSNTIFLTSGYGQLLKYYGWIAGVWWPQSGDLRKERLVGEESPGAEERFYAEYLGRAPEYFIVTSLGDLERQPDLREFLTRFVIVAQTEDYLIFDLRKTIDSG